MSDLAGAIDAVSAGEKFRSGRVIGRTFSAVSANGLLVWPIALVFIAAPAAAVAFGLLGQQVGATGNLLQSLVVGLFAIFVQGVVMKACLLQFAGKRHRVGPSLSAGVTNYAAMFGVRWLTGIGEFFGILLLVVPGLIWMTSWVVAGPALIADDLGSQGPLARSAKLTKGSRWPIFGLMLLFYLAYFAASLLVGLVIGLNWTLLSQVAPKGWGTNGFSDIIAVPFTQMVLEVFVGAGAASIYWELKLVRESGGAEAVSRVFA
jgi:hypothetical protein